MAERAKRGQQRNILDEDGANTEIEIINVNVIRKNVNTLWGFLRALSGAKRKLENATRYLLL